MPFLLVTLLSSSVVAGCHLLAGYPEFELFTASTSEGGMGGAAVGGAGGGATGGAGGHGAMGAGGAGGVVGPGPLTCTWEALSVARSLEAEPVDRRHYDGHMKMDVIPSREAVRFSAVRHVDGGSSQIELWSLFDDDRYVQVVDGRQVFGFVRLDGQTQGAVFEQERPGARGISMLAVPDSDESGASATTSHVVDVAEDVIHLDARAASPGDGTASVLYTYRLAGAAHEARLVRWDGAAGSSVPVDGNRPMLIPEDYEIDVAGRVDATTSFFVLGQHGDGATVRRWFSIPDTAMTEVAPTSETPLSVNEPLLLGVTARAEGDFLVSYASLATTPQLLLSTVSSDDLGTHDPSAFPVTAEFAMEMLPDEAAFDMTGESMLVLGHRPDSPDGMVALLAHRVSGMRFAGFVPFPEPSVLPPGYELQRVEAKMVDVGIDSSFGGTIVVAFYVTDPSGEFDMLYTGRVQCDP